MAIVEVGPFSFDPAHVTLLNLTRAPEAELDMYMEWVEAQREQRRARVAAHEERVEQIRAALEERAARDFEAASAWAREAGL